MFRYLFLLCIVFALSPLHSEAKIETQVAFTRDGNVWIIEGEREKKITEMGQYHGPKWSNDGSWLLYQQETPSENDNSMIQNKLWAYKLDTGEKREIFYDGYNPQWSPIENTVAFQSEGVLNISNLDKWNNVAVGVYGYTWKPDGKGFLLASRATLNPDGWTNPIIYTKSYSGQIENINLFKDVQPLLIIPKEVTVGNGSSMAVNVGMFKFSPSNKYVSFVLSPTASLSMDSNVLAVSKQNGTSFETIDEIIFGVGEPKWAPNRDTLAYISGSGRIVFGFKNKKLKYKEFPVSGTLTPKKYAELNFTWLDDDTIVTSRIEEKEWSNNFKEHPLPKLIKIKLSTNQQTPITNPPNNRGDYDPMYIGSVKKLIWYRGHSITDKNRDIWISDPNGKNSQLWIKNADEITFFEK
ncbi:hypothetical protein SM124_18540 [Bacillus sp. 31A1R]|uniref:TolB domain-containing protein n=1 Tax=Robertmurraya mangrovi TaxID=3098077 RepID=A0ABU5J2S7_9BACI|nr:hypothetical protein [Bacillus sp. 31A1R]MDZ5473720.1 hypothetical protein [Bacillus sp. 31A1R]